MSQYKQTVFVSLPVTGRCVEDPDGHIWEAKWMDMSAMLKANDLTADS